ncbi:hypothetical protein [Psychrobacter fjordensis]|uniref:hypothetical protein n=1 Tax=Psychrobacter fjordensis TaxID=664424 RepID=UPI00191906ED|nr:hypothetical protein [Psychrobacter fjordensis]
MKKSLPVVKVMFAAIMTLLALFPIETFFQKELKLTFKATYHNIIKVEVKYPDSKNTILVYDVQHHPEKITAIVNDINKQSYESWIKVNGGKEAGNIIGISFYDDSKQLVTSFSLAPDMLLERGENHRQIGVSGFYRTINLKDYLALQEVWCNPINTSTYNSLVRNKLC